MFVIMYSNNYKYTITIIDIWTVNWLKCFPVVICGGLSMLASTKDKVKDTAMTQEDDLLNY